METRIAENKQRYYDFYQEENKTVLKFLVQSLYDELDKSLVLQTGHSLPLRLKID